jgi:hypothetical protein
MGTAQNKSVNPAGFQWKNPNHNIQILTGFIKEFADATLYLIVAKICSHPAARSRHCLPVLCMDQNTFNKGPIFTHPRFYRMNCAQLIPKYAITVSPLSNNGSVA